MNIASQPVGAGNVHVYVVLNSTTLNVFMCRWMFATHDATNTCLVLQNVQLKIRLRYFQLVKRMPYLTTLCVHITALE